MQRLIIMFLFLAGSTVYAQTIIRGEISGNPPLTQAIIKASSGSFPQIIGRAAIKQGKFEFTFPDSVMKKNPIYASLFLVDTSGKSWNILMENYMHPEVRPDNYFFPQDTIISIKGAYSDVTLRRGLKITPTTENNVFFEGYYRKVFNHRPIRQTSVDSVVTYIKKYPNSKVLMKTVLDHRGSLTASQLSALTQAFSPDAMNTDDGARLSIYLENRLAEDQHKEYKNLVLKDRKGKEHPIFDELKDANLIIFWTSWCIPCRREIPALKKLYEVLKAKNIQVQFTHISVDEDKAKWEKADDKEAFPWQSLWAPKAETVAASYNYGLPSNFLVTKDKRIHRIDIRNQEGIDELWKVLGLKPEKFEYPELKQLSQQEVDEMKGKKKD